MQTSKITWNKLRPVLFIAYYRRYKWTYLNHTSTASTSVFHFNEADSLPSTFCVTTHNFRIASKVRWACEGAVLR